MDSMGLPTAFLLNSSRGEKSIRNLASAIAVTVGFIHGGPRTAQGTSATVSDLSDNNANQPETRRV